MGHFERFRGISNFTRCATIDWPCFCFHVKPNVKENRVRKSSEKESSSERSTSPTLEKWFPNLFQCQKDQFRILRWRCLVEVLRNVWVQLYGSATSGRPPTSIRSSSLPSRWERLSNSISCTTRLWLLPRSIQVLHRKYTQFNWYRLVPDFKV